VGDVMDIDPERGLNLILENATLTGRVEGAKIKKDDNSKIIVP